MFIALLYFLVSCVTMMLFSVCVNDTVDLLYISQLVEELMCFDSLHVFLITTCVW